jgi:cell division ATPase FtsA
VVDASNAERAIDKTKQELSRDFNRDVSGVFIALQAIFVEARQRHSTLDIESGELRYPLYQ